ncbi:hypothetical protein Cadr_000007951 [Camelus dromedarius]|uniref:Uncharacterized protein n=1 Tax=Camelus dromedarius TaxID=9838 RepID=A0A5N4DZR9_CAMDR|nr:hypothetical protein Cadr_000007951 [Camelus dromedarius]
MRVHRWNVAKEGAAEQVHAERGGAAEVEGGGEAGLFPEETALGLALEDETKQVGTQGYGR